MFVLFHCSPIFLISYAGDFKEIAPVQSVHFVIQQLDRFSYVVVAICLIYYIFVVTHYVPHRVEYMLCYLAFRHLKISVSQLRAQGL